MCERGTRQYFSRMCYHPLRAPSACFFVLLAFILRMEIKIETIFGTQKDPHHQRHYQLPLSHNRLQHVTFMEDFHATRASCSILPDNFGKALTSEESLNEIEAAA